jgi:hypothetical protein
MSTEQIIQEHSELIHRVVMQCNSPGTVPDMELVLQQAEDNDWIKLVAAIRVLIMGNRDRAMLDELDGEDRIIVDAMLRGIEDPKTLPLLQADFESHMTAPGIAGLMRAAMGGHAQAQQILITMTNSLIQDGGELGAMAGRLRPMIEGERDVDKLCANLSEQGKKMIADILHELQIYEAH